MRFLLLAVRLPLLKNTGQSSIHLNDEHFAGCKEEKSSTHFYFMYPSNQGKRQAKRDKLGCFEHLTQVIAAGFDPAAELAMNVTKNHNKGGLLILSCDNELWIKSALVKDLTPVQKIPGNDCLPF
jgi:hypothetical protein